MKLLDLLWDTYAQHVPYARTFEMLSGERLQNDHVAFRSLDLEPTARLFERLGWVRRDAYDFADAHLDAIYLSKPGEPRVFVSQLRTAELSPRARQILAQLPEDPEPPASDDPLELARWFRGPALTPREDELFELEGESQYAAWLLLFGREVNHFTASVPDAALWQQKMKNAGIPMKDELEGAPGAALRQTATRAAPRQVKVLSANGVATSRSWPYAYLEIAERNGGFDGFVAQQARQLFEMTRR